MSDDQNPASDPAAPVAVIDHYCGSHAPAQVNGADAVPTLHYRDTQAEIHRVVVGDYENNVFIVRCRDTGDAVLIDAANEHGLLLELSKNLGVRTIVETHGHHDHIGAVTEMRNAGYSVWVTQPDAHMLPSYDEILEDESVVEVGRLRLNTILNPGHTPGSMSFHLEGSPVLFSGDTLFPGGPGATKFEGGDFETIIDSIDRLMFSRFAPETIVMPGHGDDTSIGTESPHLDTWIARGW